MPEYLAPGVNYQRIDASPPGVAAIRTDVAGFVGIARRGPIDAPVPVQSWRQFQTYFGDFSGAGYLAYAVRAFFENGGARCWVVRTASRAATEAQAVLCDRNQNAVWRVAASSPGVWGNNLAITVVATHRWQTLTDPRQSNLPEYSTVLSVAGFPRGTQVKLTQGKFICYKVVSDADPIEQRLIWDNPKPEARFPYDAPLSGFDSGRPILIESVEYSLQVTESGLLSRTYEALSLVPQHPRYGPDLLKTQFAPQGGYPSLVLPALPEPIYLEELRNLELSASLLEPIKSTSEANILLCGGADGLSSLSPYDFIGESCDPMDNDAVKMEKLRGLRALEQVGEVSILAVPDIQIQPAAAPLPAKDDPVPVDPCLAPRVSLPATPRVASPRELPPRFSDADIYKVQAAMIEQCERLRDRIALLEAPYAMALDGEAGQSALRAWRSRFDSKFGAFYHPWLRVIDPLRSPASLTRDLPPCGHVAGQMARTDLQHGVHLAAANQPLNWAQAVTKVIDSPEQETLNPAGINVIRPLPGRGLRIFGARTTSSDSDWRFVNVRRLLIMIEKAIDLSTQWAAFEPNELYTRNKLLLSLSGFLQSLWQQGVLMGASSDQAFFVSCDEANNPPGALDRGYLLAEVGVAPTQPFEFIVLRVGRVNNEFEIAEVSRQQGVV